MGVCHGGPQEGMAVHCIPESALASLEVVGMKSLKRAGGMSRMDDFNSRSWEVLGALGLHFASFFRLRF